METYGSMEKKERVEFILEQMRLCLAVKDYIRTQIISKKINTKFFQEENTEVSLVVEYLYYISLWVICILFLNSSQWWVYLY